jgi:maltose O-acetyltransferase
MKKIYLKILSKIFLKLKNANQILQYESYREKYKISNKFKFNGENIIFYGEGEIQVGNNSYIGWMSTIESAKNCLVKIGDNCSISHNVRIYTSTKITNQNFNVDSKKEMKYGNVIIGNGVWIGANVFINPGIEIGDNAIVGANSVLTKNVEANSVVGGVPAKFIKYNNA